MTTQYRQQPSEESHSGVLVGTILGASVGASFGFGIAFVWWQALIATVIGLGLHAYINNKRSHAGSILLAFVGTGVIGIAAASFSVWLSN